MRKQKIIFIVGILILAAIGSLYLVVKSESAKIAALEIRPLPFFPTRIDDQPPVTIEITPVEFGKNAGVWKFDIVFDTHSGNLDEDPMGVTTLSDDKGNTYRPISWDGPGPGGHHREGALVFDAVNPAPSYVELKIKNVGGVPERSFKWGLE